MIAIGVLNFKVTRGHHAVVVLIESPMRLPVSVLNLTSLPKVICEDGRVAALLHTYTP